MRFSKKTAHRIIISLAMVFPIAYMLGTQIAALAGAHGEELLAQDIYIDSYVEVDSYVHDGSMWKFEVPNDNRPNWITSMAVGNNRFNFTCDMFAGEYTSLYRGSGSYPWVNLVAVTTPSANNKTLYDSEVYYYQDWSFYTSDDISFLLKDYIKIYRLVSVPSGVIDGYNQSLFGHLFPRGNFVEKVGEISISENPKGFAPFGAMLRYLDLNMLHAGDTQIGLMFYGMIYWMLHVILADLVYHMLVFIPNLIMRVSQWLGHGLDDDKEE